MNISHGTKPHSCSGLARVAGLALLTFACLSGILVNGCARPRTEPLTFTSPGDAVQALIDAVRADKVDRLLAVFGSEGEEIIVSGDDVSDRLGRQRFLTAYDQKHSLVESTPDSRTLVIGNDDWPFPVPLVRQNGGWAFDCDAGREEILNRRIGRNELDTIEVSKAIGDAQQEYALLDPDGNGVHEYAQQFVSDPGKRNGLYWPTAEGEKLSPLGETFAAATAEGYQKREHGSTPYHGYYYRILRAQGPTAPGGAMDYVVKGKMILGYAVVAFPADYGNSGIMTFLMGPDGVVYQKDLGEETAKLATALTAYDPGDGWKKVEEKIPTDGRAK